ncbi:hypothetical protein F5887DRAFT_1151878 [Amanita rubescens]|nr:hypothetical protein F5887DRAFT_1151878 [Amanita rubescens]
MSTQKRKRSIQDTPVDLTKMQLTRQRLSALQEELSGIEETETEMEEIMKHVDALQGYSWQYQEAPWDWSERPLRFNDAALQVRIAASDIDSKHIEALCLQITRINRSTSKRFEAGARMILDAVLLTIADISVDAKEKLHVAIFPDMQVTSGDGVLVKNPKNQFEVWLTGSVDYGICTYQYEGDRNMVLRSTLNDLMIYARNPIMLIEAKRDRDMLTDSIPEATSQAIALSEVTGNKTVRYCLSDGNEWMFLVYTCDDQKNRISYEGPILTMMQSHLVEEAFEKDVRCLVEVLYHWLRTDGDIKNDPLCMTNLHR